MQVPSTELATRVNALTHRLSERLRDLRFEHANNVSLFTRLTAHLGIIALVLIGLLLSGIELRARAMPRNYDEPTKVTDNVPVIDLDRVTQPSDIILSAVPLTAPSKKERREVTRYAVKPGDNVSVIAARFGVTPDSVIWANSTLENNPDALTVGQELFVPPVSGVLHQVAKGETITSVAARFKADPAAIFNDPFNQTIHDFKSSPPILIPGQFIMVPGGSKPIVVRQVTYNKTTPGNAIKGTSNFQWPTAACVSQFYWGRHPGVDLANSQGTAVVAADGGFVEYVGWDGSGYGNMILINHGNGAITRYAHLSAFAVSSGTSVSKGQLIGRIGSTGRSTGPHLHFELIVNGVHRNPVQILQGKTPRNCSR
ncbi:MAG: M23 family metallopeptidase [Anaerolineae bacterium]|nr:M23 family metallopeptidase [Anaerolineae bacterium]